ncbi:hypothetical protein MKW94_004956 [Papaver nudicaule]|uniref:Uncharacterized protein n=1 Tax=Papaver nudicaule TaxID=74823 RepID=A0AA41VSE5_PAPNU|nr:hypothetical protein [Papaver nudicaule]
MICLIEILQIASLISFYEQRTLVKMEMRAKKSIYMEHMSVSSPEACELGLKKRELTVTHQPVIGQGEISCSQPCRATVLHSERVSIQVVYFVL